MSNDKTCLGRRSFHDNLFGRRSAMGVPVQLPTATQRQIPPFATLQLGTLAAHHTVHVGNIFQMRLHPVRCLLGLLFAIVIFSILGCDATGEHAGNGQERRRPVHQYCMPKRYML